MSGDPYVCPHGFMALPICTECPAPTGYMRMFSTLSDFLATESEPCAEHQAPVDECDHPWKPYCKDCIPHTAAVLEGVTCDYETPDGPCVKWAGHRDPCTWDAREQDRLYDAIVHAARDVDGAWDAEDHDGAPILWIAEAGEVLLSLRAAIEAYDASPWYGVLRPASEEARDA